MNKTKIAREIGVSRSLVSQEIKRGLVKNLNSDLTEKYVYSATVGQKKHEENGTAKGSMLKIANDHKLENYIEKQILTVDKSDLTYGKYKNKKHQKKEENAVRKLHKKGRTIHERPAEVESRIEINHWEMDTIEGLKEKDAPILLVMSERTTRREIIRLIGDKTQASVVEAINRFEESLGYETFKNTFKTITTDNGSEFLNYEAIETSVIIKGEKRTAILCRCYCSWQRGTNENINKMIRRFLPKGKSFKGLSSEEVARIESWINNYPRKQFNFKSANDIYQLIGVA